ncbi:hypothetical protein AQJ91_12200 [Streptomyces dysideae]|uniref:Phosphoenolpyruvate synthase n=1 Tax=Streptomyces dysideae TaxID=909626 RepID=A0A117S1B2_9ACTN|nr:hypothetical protein AQJ91_12200 [Streptomyces dysideae]
MLTGAQVTANLAGHKLARLARLTAAGVRVPPFYALSTDCFRAVAGPLRDRIDKEIAATDFGNRAAVEDTSARIRDLLERATLPPGLEEEILAAYDAAFSPGTLVAVRASVTGQGGGTAGDEPGGEDSSRDAFAGMSDSFLYVRRSELVDRVRHCWASGFNAESLLYRHAQGHDPGGAQVAVGVQRMALGERSFVMFTCDPRTGAADTVIAAAYGIGEGVVQERVGVDHYFLRAGAADAVESRIATKPEKLGLDPERPQDGPVPLPVPRHLRERPVLSEEEIRALASTGCTIERLFGAPQDIEGTFTADGTLHLVQSRPVTIDASLRRQWSNANVTESFPGVTTTLTYTFAQDFYRTIFYDLYRRMGVPAHTLHRNQPYLDRMIGLHHGRIYYELNAWYHLHQQLAVFPLVRGGWEKMMGLSQPPGRPEAAVGPLQLAGPAAAVAYRFAVHDRAMRCFESWWERVIASRRDRDWAALDPLARIRDFQEVWADVGEHWGVTLMNDSALSTTAGIVEKLLKAWVPGSAQDSLLSDLLCGDEDNHSVDVVLSVVRLAEYARTVPGLQSALDDRPLREVWQEVEQGRFGDTFPQRVVEHLRRYGDRGLQELKMEQPSPRQTPWELLRLVGEYAQAGLESEELRRRELRIRADAEQRLATALARHPVRRRTLSALLARLRRYIRYRENSRYRRSELFGLAKEVFRTLGADLTARGALREADDVVHLTQTELFGYFDGTAPAEDLRGLAEARRREYESAVAAADETELPLRFTTLGPVRDTRPQQPAAERRSAAPPSGDGLTLRGLGSSGGRVRGVARVVLDPGAYRDDGEAPILVARETDPGWLFLMLRASGIIVERGTLLSHTAITGRKFGIPTIVAVPGATTAILDGAMVEMDGASGVVTIVEQDSA